MGNRVALLYLFLDGDFVWHYEFTCDPSGVGSFGGATFFYQYMTPPGSTRVMCKRFFYKYVTPPGSVRLY